MDIRRSNSFLHGLGQRSRRALLLVGLSAALGCAAQPVVHQVGWISPGGDVHTLPAFESFQEGMRELGYVEGRNLHIEQRWAEGSDEKLGLMARALVGARPDVIVTQTKAVFAVRAAGGNMPVVFGFSGDPVIGRLAESLAKPGRNFTGVSMLSIELVGKRMQLLKELVPKARKVAVLANPGHPGEQVELRASQDAAKALGMTVDYFPFADAKQFDAALEGVKRSGADALMVFPDNGTIAFSDRIAEFAAGSRIPAISGWGEFAVRGNVLSYGPEMRAMYRRLASYVDKILKGAKPADLPIELPTRIELVLNLKAARAIGLVIPQALLLRADRLIE